MHAACLDEWVKRRGFCPICKVDMKIFGVDKRSNRQELRRNEPANLPDQEQLERAQVVYFKKIVALPVGPQIRPGVYINPIVPPPDDELPEYIDEEIDYQTDTPTTPDEDENLDREETRVNPPENLELTNQ